MQVENNRGDRYKFCQTDSECWEFRDDLIASHTGRQDPCPLRRRNWHLKSRENQPAILSSATSEFPQQGVLALSRAKGLRRRTPIRVKTRRGANLEVRVEQLGHRKKERTDERRRRVNAKAPMRATVWNRIVVKTTSQSTKNILRKFMLWGLMPNHIPDQGKAFASRDSDGEPRGVTGKVHSASAWHLSKWSPPSSLRD
jgi:hypothetical protein